MDEKSKSSGFAAYRRLFGGYTLRCEHAFRTGQESLNSLSFAHRNSIIEMMYKASILFVLFSFAVFSVGCKNNGATPANLFAKNSQTVPPPNTFSSQGAYLGQTPGTYIPQTPATTFSPSVPVSSAQPATTPVSSNEKATLFTTAPKETDWTPVAMVPTSQTAFQAMEAKVNSAPATWNAGSPESLVVGTAYAVTTITNESQPEPPLTEPPLLLYSGN